MKANRILEGRPRRHAESFRGGPLSVSARYRRQGRGHGARFQHQTDSGKTVSARDFGGKLLILNFWATWCPPCVQEVPSLDQLERELGPKGLVVLGVSVDKDEKAYQEFLARFRVSYLTARDPAQVINTEYGTIQYPESYLIDRNGKVVEKIVGEADWSSEQMLQHVQSLL